MKELGIDDIVIQKILRHENVSTTQGSYIKVRDPRVADAMKKLEAVYSLCTAAPSVN